MFSLLWWQKKILLKRQTLYQKMVIQINSDHIKRLSVFDSDSSFQVQNYLMFDPAPETLNLNEKSFTFSAYWRKDAAVIHLRWRWGLKCTADRDISLHRNNLPNPLIGQQTSVENIDFCTQTHTHTRDRFHQHDYEQLLHTQIPKAQKDSQIIAQSFWTFGIWACKSWA